MTQEQRHLHTCVFGSGFILSPNNKKIEVTIDNYEKVYIDTPLIFLSDSCWIRYEISQFDYTKENYFDINKDLLYLDEPDKIGKSGYEITIPKGGKFKINGYPIISQDNTKVYLQDGCFNTQDMTIKNYGGIIVNEKDNEYKRIFGYDYYIEYVERNELKQEQLKKEQLKQEQLKEFLPDHLNYKYIGELKFHERGHRPCKLYYDENRKIVVSDINYIRKALTDYNLIKRLFNKANKYGDMLEPQWGMIGYLYISETIFFNLYFDKNVNKCNILINLFENYIDLNTFAAFGLSEKK